MKELMKYIFMFAAMLCMAACGGSDDVSFPDDGMPDPVNPFEDGVVTQLLEHTEGNGFPIIIMGDGYSYSQVMGGKYRSAVTKAVNALFSMEPMASLKQYCDVYEVTASSMESGIGYSKRNTVFSTYIRSKTSTDVYGDSVTVLDYAAKAVDNSVERMKHSLVIVLLNADAYAGVTLLSYDNTVTDSIPSGFSLAYIPETVTNEGRDLFQLVLQHEAVGHGIGKLADEYYYDRLLTDNDVKSFMDYGHKYGLYMNVHYDMWTPGTYHETINYQESGHSYNLTKHPVEPYCYFYPLTTDSRYASEELMWYEGAFVTPVSFFRPTKQSIMNETMLPGHDTFNAPSRLSIYKRVKREALGNTWTCDINNAEDMEAFVQFDKNNIAPVAPAKGIVMETVQASASLPAHTAPKIINLLDKR